MASGGLGLCYKDARSSTFNEKIHDGTIKRVMRSSRLEENIADHVVQKLLLKENVLDSMVDKIAQKVVKAISMRGPDVTQGDQ